MRRTDGHGAIDDYVAGLGRRLVGPARLKAELLAEARDGLTDAAEAHEAGGLDPAAARRRAIDEFGGYAAVAPAYQVELAAAQGRSTALILAAALVALRLVAPLVWSGGDVAWVASLVGAFDTLAVAGALGAGAILLAYGPAGRRLGDPVRLTRLVGRSTLVFLAVHGLAGVLVMASVAVRAPAAFAWPPALGVAVAMWLGYGFAARCAWRCLRAARPELVAEPTPG
ncbi:permease prefix domain 1-containing protein [Luedemannella helvata]|uniref:Uncharacterized protein n=1 Tax=Luedemannella helvata TaxID=349315 RepID=A0ABN2L4Z9_9ACTN